MVTIFCLCLCPWSWPFAFAFAHGLDVSTSTKTVKGNKKSGSEGGIEALESDEGWPCFVSLPRLFASSLVLSRLLSCVVVAVAVAVTVS